MYSRMDILLVSLIQRHRDTSIPQSTFTPKEPLNYSIDADVTTPADNSQHKFDEILTHPSTPAIISRVGQEISQLKKLDVFCIRKIHSLYQSIVTHNKIRKMEGRDTTSSDASSRNDRNQGQQTVLFQYNYLVECPATVILGMTERGYRNCP